MQEASRKTERAIATTATHARIAFVLLVLMASALAGCLDDDVDTGDPADPANPPRGYEDLRLKPAESNSLETELNAVQIVAEDDPDWDRPNLTKDDWMLLSTTLSEQGSVVAFEWEYPKEAVVSNSQTGGDVVALDFALALGPMGMTGALPEDVDWMMLGFYEREDEDKGWETALGGFKWGAATETTEWALDGESEVATRPARADPFLIRLGAGEDTGDKMYLVLAARGPAGSPFGVGVRMLGQQEAGRESSPTDNWDAFTTSVEARDVAPFVPERVSEKEGMLIARHIEERRQGANDAVERTYDIDPPSEDLPTEPGAVAPPRSSVFTSGADWGGWSNVDIRYENSPSGNHWIVSGSIHGQDANRDVLLTSQTPRVCRAMVEGSNGAQIENSIVNTVTTSETIRYEHFSANVQLEPISGYPLRSTWNC